VNEHIEKNAANNPCCVCSGTTSKEELVISYPEHGYPGKFILRRCNGCGLYFNSPRLGDAGMHQLYDGSYYFFARDDARELRRAMKIYQRSVALVADEIREKRVLLIGCGKGYLAALLSELGWETFGIDVSSAAADYACEHFNLKVFTGTLEEYVASASVQTFPLVLAIDVLEHVIDPQGFLQAATQVMEPGGQLLLDTPNARAANIARQGSAWRGFNPFHIFIFSPENLTRLLSACGLTVTRVFSYNNQAAGGFATAIKIALMDIYGKLGLAGMVYRVLLGVRRIFAAFAPRTTACDAAAAASSAGDYFTTADSRAGFAAENQGDNLIVIARQQ